jgi:uncharacterized membrane protein YfhO
MAKKQPNKNSTENNQAKLYDKVNTENKVNIQPTVVVDFFEVILGKKAIFLLGALLLFILFVLFGSFLFGDRLFLFKDIASDTINFYYPRHYYISQYLSEEGLPKWSFSEGMGQNILPYSIGDPFNWILYAMGKDNLAYGIVWIELLKLFLSGVTFFSLLKLLKFTNHSAIIGALAYSFSGFLVVGSGWYDFTTQGFYFAALLLSFEYLFQKNRWWPFSVVVFLFAFYSPFYLYLAVILIFIYSTMRMVDVYGSNIKKYFPTYFMMLGLGIVGVLMGMVMLVSSVDQMLNSARVSGEASMFSTLSSKSPFSFAEEKHNLTAIARLFANDLVGDANYHAVNTAQGSMNVNNFSGWYNYLEAPALYSGLFILLLIPQAIILSSGRKRILFIIGLLMAILPVIFPYFRYAFWLFAGDYYRTFCLFFSMAFIFVAVKALDIIYNKRKVNLLVLGLSLVFLIMLMFVPFSNIKEVDSNVIDGSFRNILIMFLLAHTFVIGGLGFSDYRQTARIALLGLVSLELLLISSYTYHSERPVITKTEYKQKVNYNDFTKDAVTKLKEKDKDFYRISKYYQSGPAMHGSMNDAKLQGYYGTMSYQSFNQKNYIRFLGDMGIIDRKVEHETRWAKGLQENPLVQIIASNKYILVKQNTPSFPGHTLIDSVGDVKILKNDNYLPLGFTYDKFLDSSSFHKLPKVNPNLHRQITLLKAIVLDDKDVTKFKLEKFDTTKINLNYTLDELGTDVKALRGDTLIIEKFSQNNIIGKINLSQPKALFLSIPYDPSWKLKVNGKSTDILVGNLGLMAVPLEKGSHKIELSFQPPYWSLSWTISLLGFVLFGAMILLNRIYIKRKKNAVESK